MQSLHFWISRAPSISLRRPLGFGLGWVAAGLMTSFDFMLVYALRKTIYKAQKEQHNQL